METKDVLQKLRESKGMTQAELAEKLFVTRQAVSRWENGETIPSTDTLKMLSKIFDVSINTLLGSPQKLICQCCGMPLEDDAILSREPDGTINEDYCKWCYTDGEFVYKSLEEITDFLVKRLSSDKWPEAEVRAFFEAELPRLKHWKKKNNNPGERTVPPGLFIMCMIYQVLILRKMNNQRPLDAAVFDIRPC